MLKTPLNNYLIIYNVAWQDPEGVTDLIISEHYYKNVVLTDVHSKKILRILKGKKHPKIKLQY